MKFFIRCLSILLFVFFLSKECFAQERFLGVTYGNSVFLGSGEFSKTYFSSLAVKYQIKNKERADRIYISESVEGLNDFDKRFRHLKTEVGGDLIIGGRLFYVIGVGLNVKILLMEEGFNEEFKEVSFGGKFNTGLGYEVSQKILVDIVAQYQVSFTPFYAEFHQSPGGAYLGAPADRVNKNESVLFLQVGLHYLIKSSK